MKLNSDFWSPITIKPVPSLAHLRELVLAHSEKRSPKWKFRLASDLVVQIQPKLTTSLLRFDCYALQCDGANLETLLAREKADGDYWVISFQLRAFVADQWEFKPTRWRKRFKADDDILWTMRDRLVAAFGTQFDRLRPESMLGQHCLVCGKALTDPVSMARLVGPECAGTASTILPFIVELTESRKARVDG